MLQVFRIDVAKIDRDVAYVAMVVHIRCKRLSPMFHLCFWTYCCKCFYMDVAYIFTHMLQVFYPYIAYVCNGFQVFSGVLEARFKHFICLLLYIASVIYRCFKSRSSECSRSPSLATPCGVYAPSYPMRCLCPPPDPTRRMRPARPLVPSP